MRKQNLFLGINAVILLMISILFLVFYQSSVPKEPKDKLFGQMITLGEEQIITNLPTLGHFTVVHTVQTATNNKGQEVGKVYHVIARNGYKFDSEDDFGYIELLVGIDQNQKVYVQPLSIRQTSTYVGGIQDYVINYFQGIGFGDLILIPVINVGDLEAGATASESTGLVKNMIAMAIDQHVSLSASLSEVNDNDRG